MRATAMIALLPAMLLAAACSGKDRTGADDELKKDLALAASDGLGMAPAPRTNAVSAVELGQPQALPTPQTRKMPKKGKARPHVAVVEPTVAETKIETTEPTPEPTVVAESPEPTTTTEEPIATPRPRPIPVGIPSGAGSGGTAGDGSGSGTAEPRGGGGVGSVIGTVIGVIIRGGMAGEDHCDPRTDGHRRGGVVISSPSPFPGTIIRGVPSGIPINPMVPRMIQATGGRMTMPRR